MRRRDLLAGLGGVLTLSLTGGGVRAHHGEIRPMKRSEAQWKEQLSREQFQVLRKEGTEPPGSSPLLDEKRAGTYVCAGCGLALFSSETKYESGTGWPSFYQPIEGHVDTERDWKLLYPRTEYHCARCGGHQGHVFEDGPPPTGLRYCNNGLALRFEPGEPPVSEG